MTDAIFVLRGLEEMYPELRFIEHLRNAMETYPKLNWKDAMSRGQIQSKMWLVHQLVMNNQHDLGTVAVCGGWLGILPRLLLDSEQINVDFIESIDYSALATLASRLVNDDYVPGKFGSLVANCYDQSYAENFNTVINTSCEHFEEFTDWYDKIMDGRLVVLQSNDFTDIEDHVNCVSSADELAEQAPMSTVIFKGALPCYKYTRYMVIGVK